MAVNTAIVFTPYPPSSIISQITLYLYISLFNISIGWKNALLTAICIESGFFA